MASEGKAKPTLPPKPAGARWTDEQWAGVATTGGSLLVSAAAGSGKTAVLAERCAFLVCDAAQPCDVDELLVVTFTEAAAAEMKGRIDRALRERIATDPSPRLMRQLALIDRSQVSTLHGFCARLIRQHFHLLDLDPAFTVIDGDEAKLLRAEVARELFEEHYESADPQAFRALVDAYADGNDERLIAKLLQTHDLLGSLRDPQEWTAAAHARLSEPAAAVTAADFRTTALGRALAQEIETGLAALERSCDRAVESVSRMKGFEKYVADLLACQQIARHWRGTLEKHGIDALSEEAQVELPKLPSVPNSAPGKQAAKRQVEAVRERIKGGALRRMLSFSTVLWRQGLASVVPHARTFLNLVEDFGRRYAAQKASLRGVDFSDLERLALRALREPDVNRSRPYVSPGIDRDGSYLFPSAVARTLHRQFAHVLVDEYQDINEVQDAILHLASRECVSNADDGGRMKAEGDGASPLGHRPASVAANLFCVGDVKQSIYRFRLAEPTRFLDRLARFKDDNNAGVVIDLQTNFRSRELLLAAINCVFERLMTRESADLEYDKSQMLHPGATFLPGDATCFTGAPIELHLLPAKLEGDDVDGHDAVPAATGDNDDPPDRAQREAMLIARRVGALIKGEPASEQPPMRVFDKESQTYRPLRYGDIVILLRSMRHKGDVYAEVLRRSGIPVHNESGTGYFESMEVNDVLSLLKMLDNRAQDIPLAAVLRSPIAGLPDPEDALARVRLAYPDRSIAFHRAVARYAKEQSDDLAAKLNDVIGRLDRWRMMAQRRPLAELIWDVYDSTGYLAFCTGLHNGEQRKANLIDLHDRARQFGSFQWQGLARFLAFLDQLREESDLGQPPVVSEGENVVRIMTIHHSKGLEFPVVFIPDLGKRINLQDCAGSILVDRHAYLGMDVVDEVRQVRYPSLASTLVASRLRRQSMAEELRVLYVAMTRAKEHLILIGTTKADAADTWVEQWAGFAAALPGDTVLGATSMLDWIGPAAVASRTPAAAMSNAGTDEPIQIITHDVSEVVSWPSPESFQPAASERQQRLARLQPLHPAPSADEESDAMIARLTAGYGFAPLTKLAAVEAATAITKKGNSTPVAAGSSAGKAILIGKPLELPRAVRTELKPSAASIGEATHLVLQHLDFAQACDGPNLKLQIADLVDRRLMDPAAAESVDLDSIHWLIASDVGTLIRAHAASLRRELPLYLAVPPQEFDPTVTSDDPQDHVMVRSRLDLLVTTPRGVEIVDYKTDRVTEQTLGDRVEFYRPQMDLYRRAVEAMTGMPPAAVHLVFLHARRIVSV